MMILQTIDLAIGYGTTRIASDLTIQLSRGTLVALLGPNGSGKSTLMRTIAGLQPVLSGEILFNDRPLSTIRPSELARLLSVVLTERNEAGDLSVYELVALGRTPYTNWLGRLLPADHQHIQEALRVTNTTDFANRKLRELSDGERQRVMLARALAQDTDLILLDEPTAHLDLPSRVEMMKLLHQLARDTNKAILLSTHELDLALQAADECWLFSREGKLEYGTPEDLVLTGNFEKAFAQRGFHFDPDTGNFNLHDTPTGPAVHVTGQERFVFWTRRALLREGFRLSSESSFRIEATANGWILPDHTVVSSIESLLFYLRQNPLFPY